MALWDVYFGPLSLGRLHERHMRIEDHLGGLVWTTCNYVPGRKVPCFTPDSSAFRPSRRGEVKHALLAVANADMRDEHAKSATL
jgi:hypothetical protein